jgi:hypothetical protein
MHPTRCGAPSNKKKSGPCPLAFRAKPTNPKPRPGIFRNLKSFVFILRFIKDLAKLSTLSQIVPRDERKKGGASKRKEGFEGVSKSV